MRAPPRSMHILQECARTRHVCRFRLLGRPTLPGGPVTQMIEVAFARFVGRRDCTQSAITEPQFATGIQGRGFSSIPASHGTSTIVAPRQDKIKGDENDESYIGKSRKGGGKGNFLTMPMVMPRQRGSKRKGKQRGGPLAGGLLCLPPPANAFSHANVVNAICVWQFGQLP